MQRIAALSASVLFLSSIGCIAQPEGEELVDVGEHAQSSADVPTNWLTKKLVLQTTCNVHRTWFDTTGLSGYWNVATDDVTRPIAWGLTFVQIGAGDNARIEVLLDRTGGPSNVPDQPIPLHRMPSALHGDSRRAASTGRVVDEYNLAVDVTSRGGTITLTSTSGQWSYGRVGYPGDRTETATCSSSFDWATAQPTLATTPNLRQLIDTQDSLYALCNNGKSGPTLDPEKFCANAGGSISAKNGLVGAYRLIVVATECSGAITCRTPGCGWTSFMPSVWGYERPSYAMVDYGPDGPTEFRISTTSSRYSPTPRVIVPVTNGEFSWAKNEREVKGVFLPSTRPAMWMTYSFPQKDQPTKRTTCTTVFRTPERWE